MDQVCGAEKQPLDHNCDFVIPPLTKTQFWKRDQESGCDGKLASSHTSFEVSWETRGGKYLYSSVVLKYNFQVLYLSIYILLHYSSDSTGNNLYSYWACVLMRY